MINVMINFRARDIFSDYELLLSILNAFTVDTKEYCTRCNSVNNAKGLQIAGLAKWISKWGSHGTLKNIVGHHGWPTRKIFEV